MNLSEVEAMDIKVGDVLIMKKNHPVCGSDKMKVLRAGADFRLSCEGCGRVVMTPRSKCEKNVKSVIRSENQLTEK